MSTAAAHVFVPATIGNVGPGFDVLGAAVEGLGDKIRVELVDGPSSIGDVRGRDAAHVPRDAASNCAAVAALSLLRRLGDGRGVRVSFERGLPISGGLGSSAAASVGGAYAAALATGQKIATPVILAAALDGEEQVAGRHLDNIAPAFFGGLCVVLGSDPPEVARAPVMPPPSGAWWLAVVTPDTKLSTKDARAVLPLTLQRSLAVRQMAHVSGLLTAFATGDAALVRRSLDDLYAEPLRAPLIPGFAAVKQAALSSGALGCSISGAGPTVFALTDSEALAKAAAGAMVAAFSPLAAVAHVGRLAAEGARQL